MTLLTATGARPVAWGLCEQLMTAQDYTGAVRWVVVDDGPTPQPLAFVRDHWSLDVIRPLPAWRPGQNTQARNLSAGLAAIAADERVVIIEDDDWYAPDWLTHVVARLDGAELVGESCARYYHVRAGRQRQLHNDQHASLCATALQGRAIHALREVCAARPTYLDIELWRRPLQRRLFDGHRVVGIKGLPGRPGIGNGHAPTFGELDGAGRPVLKDWVGAAWAKRYREV